MAAQMFNIIWDDVIFKKDSIEFDIGRLKTILKPVVVKGSLEALNLLKNDYFNRLYSKKLYKLRFDEGRLMKDDSPGWPRLLDALELIQEHYEIKLRNRPSVIIHRHQKLDPNELVDLYEEFLSRTDYLKHLAKMLNEEFRLIPVREYSNGKFEDSFLFRFRNRNGNILLVWENVNVSRATYVFKFSQEKHKEVLKNIEFFITNTDFEHKRSVLSGKHLESRKIKKKLCFYQKYSHEDFPKFKSEIEYLISYTV
jgi:hypothetical protein